jgi:hypothetical protein
MRFPHHHTHPFLTYMGDNREPTTRSSNSPSSIMWRCCSVVSLCCSKPRWHLPRMLTGRRRSCRAGSRLLACGCTGEQRASDLADVALAVYVPQILHVVIPVLTALAMRAGATVSTVHCSNLAGVRSAVDVARILRNRLVLSMSTMLCQAPAQVPQPEPGQVPPGMK